MTRPEWAIPSAQGPDAYAPSDRRTTEESGNGARVTFLRPQSPELHQSSDRAAAHLDALILRVAGRSMDEIDAVIRELDSMRALLRDEGEA